MGRVANRKWLRAMDEGNGIQVLTAREREILQLLAEGKISKEVATLLNLSTKTVETHRTNLMRKLSCHCVSELVRYAVRNHLVEASALFLTIDSEEPLLQSHRSHRRLNLGSGSASAVTIALRLWTATSILSESKAVIILANERLQFTWLFFRFEGRPSR